MISYDLLLMTSVVFYNYAFNDSTSITVAESKVREGRSEATESKQVAADET